MAITRASTATVKPYVDEQTVAWLTLQKVTAARHRRVRQIDLANQVREAGSASNVLETMAGGGLWPDEQVTTMREAARRQVARWAKTGIDTINLFQPEYPNQLACAPDAPIVMFTQGLVVPEDQAVAVVGTRNPTQCGVAMAQDAARILAERGLTVVSGLAEGIDTAAHTETLRAGGRTVAILGTGLDVQFPAVNTHLRAMIGQGGGLVASQFMPHQTPVGRNFLARNHTISGYSLAVIVVQAGEYSGTRNLVRKATEQGRPVILSAQVASTSWGADAARQPGVCVVGTHCEVVRAIDKLLAARHRPATVPTQMRLAA